MKRIISVVCVLAIVLAAAVLPQMVNATSAVSITHTYLHRVTASTVNGETVYATGNWNAGSITFDYEIESGYTYYLIFDYKGWNKAASGGQLPKVSTVASTDESSELNNVVDQAVAINLPHSEDVSEYTSVWCEISSEDLLASGGKYLAINWVHLLVDSYFKNFKIIKTECESEKPLIAYLHNTTPEFVDGEAVYTTGNWNAGSITFDYEIEAGYMYYLSFDYLGKETADGQVPKASTVATTDKSSHLNDVVENALSLNVPESKNEYCKVLCKLSGDDLLASGGKYLAINWKHLYMDSKFKNFRIHRTSIINDGYIHPVTLKTGDVIRSTSDSETVYTFSTPSSTPAMTFDYQLEKDKTYVVNFDYILNGGYAGSSSVAPAFTAVENIFTVLNENNSNFVSAELVNNTDWTNITVTVNANDIITETDKTLMFYGVNPTVANSLKVKNFIIGEIDPNAILSNGTFEAGEIYWDDKDNCASVSTDVANGLYSVNLKGGSYSLFTHSVVLETNKNYKLSFKYKGTFSKLPNWGILKGGAVMDSTNLLQFGTLQTTSEWNEQSVVFATGEDTAFSVIFQTGSGCDFLIDDVIIEETSETAEENYQSKIPEYTETEADNRFWHWDAKTEDANLVKNGSFDGDGGNWQSLLNEGTFTLYTTDNAKSGDKVLKFEAYDMDVDSRNYMYVECEPDTEYMLSVWHRGENWSKTNKNDLRWGIADPITGDLIYAKFIGTTVRGWNLTTWDNEWHRTTLKFNSGNNSVIALAYIGGNSVAYVDDLQIFKYDDRLNSRPTVMVQEKPTVVVNSPENIICDEEDNLIKNFDFEADDTSFWSGENSMGYKGTISQNYLTVLDWDGTVEIVNTESSHGNALYYTANDKYTGYPLSTSYIKYIDIKPDTEYTFAADFCIEKAGNGRFALVCVNDFYPREITDWQTFGEDYFDLNYKWQTVSYTFNSNEYDKVAFVVQDKGGSAYIDNIRIFETSAGKPAQSGSEISEIESEKYTITDGYININELSVTVGEVLDSFNISSGIRVFDKDGKEITDKNAFVTPYMQFKYMDGITLFDTVTALIKGDLNGDSYVDVRDLVRMKKILTKVVSDTELKGDFNTDGIVDGLDLTLLKKRMILKK